MGRGQDAGWSSIAASGWVVGLVVVLGTEAADNERRSRQR
eukprot:CAMPEP_0185841978 /NCGR_PEP_ID=MMETSP1353-20130828/18174_1 /TAXON_ID=1077150 /ORGANISM="Erythrolobus australicus, Strain CCMP3124" /LENGTH=39 /DNA_ID= /DNA_START= /DNA_END= /DNA_ORIENTATION=